MIYQSVQILLLLLNMHSIYSILCINAVLVHYSYIVGVFSIHLLQSFQLGHLQVFIFSFLKYIFENMFLF